MPTVGPSPWLPEHADGDDDLERVFGLVPLARQRYLDLDHELWRSAMPPDVLELCRLRVAQLVGCDAERDTSASVADLDDETRDALADWPTDPRFDDRTRAVLAFAELYVIDPSQITDDDCARLHQHFSSPQLAALTTALATFDAMARFQVALGVADRSEPGL